MYGYAHSHLYSYYQGRIQTFEKEGSKSEHPFITPDQAIHNRSYLGDDK